MLSPVTEGGVTIGILGFFIPISAADSLWNSEQGYCDSDFLQSTLEERRVFFYRKHNNLFTFKG